MFRSQEGFLQNRMANVQLDLLVAAYTKVPIVWRDDNYTPDFNKLYFIMEGEGYLKIGGHTHYPTPGQLYLLPAGVEQSYGTLNSNTFGKYWCHFSSKVGDLELFSLVETSPFIQIQDQADMRDKFEQLIHWHHRDSLTSKMRITSILLDIICTFMERCDAIQINLGLLGPLEKVQSSIDYINDHLGDRLSVSELAQRLHFHPNYFIRIFKKATGYTPVQYVNRLRMERAKHLLSSTDANVLTIADSIAMDIAYFSRMFKGNTGFTPTRYREMFSDGPQGS